MEWKQNLIPPRSITNNIIESEIHSEPEKKVEFDVNLFFTRLKLLLNQNQTDLLYEIEEQIKPFDYIELFGVLNSQLSSYVFHQIENFSDETPPQFIISCLNLCTFFTSININKTLTKNGQTEREKKKRLLIELQKRYQDFITPKFIDSLKAMLNSEIFLNRSLLLISTIFYQTENLYEYINVFEILDHFVITGNEQILSICSLILKRLLKCDFQSNWIKKFPDQILDKLFQYSITFLDSKFIFAQIKTLQMLSKLVLIYLDHDTIVKSVDFFKNVINNYAISDEIIYFGNILHLILSIMEKTQSTNFISLFFNEICICEIIKQGLSSNFIYIQSASTDILSILISLPSQNSIKMLIDSNMVEFIVQTIYNSNFKEKEKIRKAFFRLFWRDDINFEDILENNGIRFLIESISMWPNEIIHIFNMLIMKYPNLVGILFEKGIINDLDELILNDQEIDENGRISAQALKMDILKIVNPKE